MRKQSHYIIKGMQKDLSESTFSPEFSFDNRNIRITPLDDNTLLSAVNEKGTAEITITDKSGNPMTVVGLPIGKAVIDNKLILFTTLHKKASAALENNDRIYKFIIKGNGIEGELLYEGELNFDTEHPIETLISYENEKIQKVYWTDGKNQPRVINVTSKNKNQWKTIDKPFDFVRELQLKEKVEISRNEISSGIFAPGTIQYSFTYFNMYGQESNIFYSSPLFYTSHNDRGAKPGDTVNNSFDISITNLDDNFEYVRIYSILRTSINGIPEVKNVIDIPVNKETKSILFTDNGTTGSNEDPYKLLYVGGERVIFNTMEQKDDTLFLGDATLDRKIIPEGITDYFIDYKDNLHFGKHVNDFDYTINVIEPIDSRETDIWIDTKPDLSEYIYVNSTFIYNKNTYRVTRVTKGDIATIIGVENDIDNIAKKRGNITIKVAKDTYKGNKEIVLPSPNGFYPYKNQLDSNSEKIKNFKYLETYRLGVQFQHKTGKWSEPVWIDDKRNEVPIEYNEDTHSCSFGVPEFSINNSNLIASLYKEDYIKVRPVVVYPEMKDRECICQGMVCPTVYNEKSRIENAPFVQSSWFARPNINEPIVYDDSVDTLYSGNGPYKDEYFKADKIKLFLRSTGLYQVLFVTLDTLKPSTGTTYKIPVKTYSKILLPNNHYIDLPYTGSDRNFEITLGAVSGNTYKYEDNGSFIFYGKKEANLGSEIEFRHNYPLKASRLKGGEIQNIDYGPGETPKVIADNIYDKDELITEANSKGNIYYVDQSIFTLHSPEIEFDSSLQAIDKSNLKFRIVGYAPITSYSGDINIAITSKGPNMLNTYKELYGVDNVSSLGHRTMSAGNFVVYSYDFGSTLNKGIGVYPFGPKRILYGKSSSSTGENDIECNIDHKIISNLKYSYNNKYLYCKGTNSPEHPNIWNAEVPDSDTLKGISGVAIYSDDIPMIKLKSPVNSNYDSDIIYSGNVDSVSLPSDNKGYPTYWTRELVSNKEYPYSFNNHDVLNEDFIKPEDLIHYDPIPIKYKSTPHAVIALNYTADKKANVLPTMLFNGISGMTPLNTSAIDIKNKSNSYYFWDRDIASKLNGVSQGGIADSSFWNSVQGKGITGVKQGWLWIGELYNDNVINRFGGTSKEALINNKWLPCGEPVSLIDEKTKKLKNSIDIIWEEGDTYYQRYDNLKTYPASLEDINGIVDIVSFMCETHINIDGRYDRNRGLKSNVQISPKIFNLLNNGYSQDNNFFNYNGLDEDRFNLNDFHNTITWTLTKQAGDIIDKWTNITMANTLNLDGDKGPVRAIKRFNNNLIAFQDTGISNILFNENVQIASSEGVPIEIANSGKVQGKRYLSNKVGCRNKWSIAESPYGLYFIDDITKGIYNFNGQLNNLSDSLGFHSWVNNKLKYTGIWNPEDFNEFVTYYNKKDKEVYFIASDECLCYSEMLGTFTSFYSYNNVPYYTNLEDKGIFINPVGRDECKLWSQHEGPYNSFFSSLQPFSVEYLVNPDMPLDKIFNTVEFRADTFDGDNLIDMETFDTLEVKNEYQNGSSDLTFKKGKPSNLKKKFRIWRADIPRDNKNKMDRIRNPWIYLKLAKKSKDNHKTILHDVTVDYFE